MKTLIIYDSVFGNTQQVAQTLGNALGTSAITLKVEDVSPQQITDIDLLVVGSPTRKFRPTEGLSQFLKNLPEGSLKGKKAVSFDTRIPLETIDSGFFRSIVKMGGYADKHISELMRKKGAVVLPGEGFFVKGEQGPLCEGELQRAAEWISRIEKSAKIL